MSHEIESSDQQFLAIQPSTREDGAIEISTEATVLVISGDLDAFVARLREACDLAEEDDESDERECSRCGEPVQVLNSADECAGCEEERAQHRVCIGCDETIADDEIGGFQWADECQICSSCEHNATRSGWSDSPNSPHPHGFGS